MFKPKTIFYYVSPTKVKLTCMKDLDFKFTKIIKRVEIHMNIITYENDMRIAISIM